MAKNSKQNKLTVITVLTAIAVLTAIVAASTALYVGYTRLFKQDVLKQAKEVSDGTLSNNAKSNLRGSEITEIPSDYDQPTEEAEVQDSIEGVPDPLAQDGYNDILEDPDFQQQWHNEFDILYALHQDLDLLVQEADEGCISHFRVAAYPGKDFENFCCKYFDKLKQELKDKGYGDYSYEFVKMVHGAYPEGWEDIDINEDMDLYVLKWTKVQG